jgi:hypothetical protein
MELTDDDGVWKGAPMAHAKKNPNRYAEIHMLFNILGQYKADIDIEWPKTTWHQRQDIYKKAKTAKAYWKALLGYETLKECSDEELKSLCRIVRERIKYIATVCEKIDEVKAAL